MIKPSIQFLLFTVLFSLGTSSYAEDVEIFYHKRVLKLGDDPAWSQPELDDSDWEPSGRTEIKGVFWVRFEVDIDEKIELLTNVGLTAISIGSYEAYWDGELIYKNGKVGRSKAEEIPGTFLSEFYIPDSLAEEGRHYVAFRVSNFHNEHFRGSWNTMRLEEYGASQKKELRLTAIMFILGGGYLIAAIYYFLMFITQRRDPEKLIFSLMCFLFFGLIVMEFYKFLVPYEYHFHFIRLLIIGWLTVAIYGIVPYFFHRLFDLPYGKYFIALYTGLTIYLLCNNPLINDQTAVLLSTIMLIVTILQTIFAMVLKRKGSVPIMLALVLIFFFNFFSDYNIGRLIFNYDINLFVSFTILVLAILYLMAQKNKARELEYESTLLKSARLRNELLKKNIQPHFIMNTLTSIMEWVELSPKKSIAFIEALAGEFEILSKIADLKLIPIQQEIDLIQHHLEIMEFRKEVKYELETENIDLEELIPPAILHTIIENGISHSTPIDGKIIFRLASELGSKSKKYTVKTIAKNRTKKKASSGGTGLKYVESRLSESYGQKWTLNSQADQEGWITTIEILE